MLTRFRTTCIRPAWLSAVLTVHFAISGMQQSARAQSIGVQTPVFGVAINADGVLSLKSYPDPNGKLTARRIAEARLTLREDIARRTDLRKVSLIRLERAIAGRIEAGEKPDDEMMHLAGLQRMQFVFYDPDERDIVIAGPAEGWVEDLSGRTVGLTTGRPTLLLEDLIVALRAYSPGTIGKPFLGCTIQPTADGLAKMAQFQKTIPRTISQAEREPVAARIAKGLRDSLGMTKIRVFGISDKTHFAQVLIEADYRMKLIGIGLEPPPVKMVTYLSELQSPRSGLLERWWFTPYYDCLKVSDDRLALELVGQGVRLQGEDVTVTPDGQLNSGGQMQSKPSELYCTAFTRKYEEIAARAPVYVQLRNMIDLAVAAAFIREQDYYGKSGWNLGVFAQEDQVPVETLTNPTQIPCAVNVLWKGSRLLAPAGGVSIHAHRSLEADQIQPDKDGSLKARHRSIQAKRPADTWWWD